MNRNPKTILWVEDDRYILADYRTLLEDKGYIVLCASSLNEGKEATQENHEAIDLAVIDVRMEIGGDVEVDHDDSDLAKSGYESGLVLARWIRKTYPSIPILGFSGYANEQTRRWFEEYAAGFRSKAEIFESIDELTNWLESAMNPRRRPKQTPKVFIVHGHDDKAKLELKNYLQNTLRLGRPIILHEQPSLGRTIIEKFEEEVQGVNLVFVLLTPDDVVYPEHDSNETKRRARQNVILEMGYFLGRLGRKRGGVLLLYKGPLELPSDVSGLIYIDITDGIEAAGENLRRELQGIV